MRAELNVHAISNLIFLIFIHLTTNQIVAARPMIRPEKRNGNYTINHHHATIISMDKPQNPVPDSARASLNVIPGSESKTICFLNWNSSLIC